MRVFGFKLIQSSNRSTAKLGFLLAIGLSIAFLLMSIVLNWRQVSEFQWEIKWEQLVLSWAFYSAILLLVILAWGIMMQELAGFRGVRKNVKYFCLSSLVKHIPGNLWYVASRTYLYEKEGVNPANSSVALVLELCFTMISAVLIYVVFLPYLSGLPGIRPEFLAAIVSPMALVLAKPSLLEKIANTILRRFRKPEIRVVVSYQKMFFLLLLYSISWVFSGAMLFAFVSSVHPLGLEEIPAMIAISAASGLAGLLAFMAPAGFGIKDAALAVLLSGYVPLPIAVVISVLYRIWLLICEMIWLGISLRF